MQRDDVHYNGRRRNELRFRLAHNRNRGDFRSGRHRSWRSVCRNCRRDRGPFPHRRSESTSRRMGMMLRPCQTAVSERRKSSIEHIRSRRLLRWWKCYVLETNLQNAWRDAARCDAAASENTSQPSAERLSHPAWSDAQHRFARPTVNENSQHVSSRPCLKRLGNVLRCPVSLGQFPNRAPIGGGLYLSLLGRGLSLGISLVSPSPAHGASEEPTGSRLLRRNGRESLLRGRSQPFGNRVVGTMIRN
jgi:hypothetical protein